MSSLNSLVAWLVVFPSQTKRDKALGWYTNACRIGDLRLRELRTEVAPMAVAAPMQQGMGGVGQPTPLHYLPFTAGPRVGASVTCQAVKVTVRLLCNSNPWYKQQSRFWMGCSST